MFTKLLVPLDGSQFAERALPYATFLAKRSRGRLVLVQAVDEESQAQPEAALLGIAARLRMDGVDADCIAAVGEASSAIDLAVMSHETDAVVMSTHGHGSVHMGYGSVAENTLRLSGRPVLAIPPRCTIDWSSGMRGTVLVPLDGSRLAEEALEPAAALARLLGAALTLVQVAEPPATAVLGAGPLGQGPSVDLQQWLEEVRPYGQSVAARLRAGGVEAATEILTGDPATSIAHLAERRRAAAIAMATHSRTGLERVRLGSVADGVIQRASVPVLLLRPFAPEAATRSHAAAAVEG